MNLAIITGASKGLGRAISEAFATSFYPAHFILLSRNIDGLHETEQVLARVLGSTFSSHSIDFSDLDHLDANLDAVFKEVNYSTPFFSFSLFSIFSSRILGTSEKMAVTNLHSGQVRVHNLLTCLAAVV